MLKFAALALAALCASACTYGSAVDVAPFKDRTPKAVLADGDYCETIMTSKPYQVKSTDGCMRLKFDAENRLYMMTDLEKPKKDNEDPQAHDLDLGETVPVAVVALGGGVFLAQVDTEAREAEKRNSPDKHQLMTFVAVGDAFVTIPVLQDADFVRVAKRNKRVTFHDLPDTKAQPNSDNNELFARRPWIEKGSIPDIKAFLRDATRESVRVMKPDDWKEMSVGVRDVDQTPNHAASDKQAKDADAVMKIVRAMK